MLKITITDTETNETASKTYTAEETALILEVLAAKNLPGNSAQAFCLLIAVYAGELLDSSIDSANIDSKMDQAQEENAARAKITTELD